METKIFEDFEIEESYGVVSDNQGNPHEYKYIDVKNIRPSDLNKKFTIRITHDTTELYNGEYSALQALYDMKTLEYIPSELYKAIENYYVASSEYFKEAE